MNRNKSIRVAILCLSLAMAGSLPIDAQKVTFHEGSISLKQAFEKLESSSAYKIAYNDSQLDVSRKVSMDQKDMEVLQVLSQLLKNTGYTYKINGNYVIIVPEEVKTVKGKKQVSGVIVDTNGDPVIGANVVEKGTTNGTITDLDGKFTLEVNDNSVLQVSYIGYNTQELSVAGKTDFSVKLGEDTQALDEVVVVGYGTMKKVNLTGAVSSVSSEDLVKRHVGQSSMLLQGNTPGITVTQTSGQPGKDGGSIKIRGIGTLNNSSPLVLVDGLEMGIDNVDPNLIESISVLKDASSAAIYGSRAANGVILVTTKRAQEGGFSVSLNSYFGWQQRTDVRKPVDAIDHMRMLDEAYRNVDIKPLYGDEYIEEYRQKMLSDPDNYPNLNWQDELYTGNGFQTNNFLTVTGGTEKMKVLAGIGYFRQNGLIPNTSYDRYTARFNTDLSVSSKFSIKFDVFLRAMQTKEPSSNIDEIVYWANRMPANQPNRLSNGLRGIGWDGTNPSAMAEDGGLREELKPSVAATGGVQYKITDWLSAEGNVSLHYVQIMNSSFSKIVNTYFPNGNLAYEKPTLASLTEERTTTLNKDLKALLKFDKSFSHHNLKALFGYSVETYGDDVVSAFRDNFAFPEYPVLNAGSRDNQRANGTGKEWILQSYFGRVNYDYASKYLFEANLRYDGSSRFAPGHRWGLFPSFSVGWRISEEEFFQGAKPYIQNMKIRASYGHLGNQLIGEYRFTSYLGYNTYVLGGKPIQGAALNDMANSEISWETTKNFDIGLDISLLDDKLNLTADYYQKRTSDILMTLNIPLTVGLNAPIQNAGKVENKGWEIGATYRNKISDLNYSVGLTLSDVKNKVLDLKGIKNSGLLVNNEGYPMNSLYGYKAIGYITQEDMNEDGVYAGPQQFGKVMPGDIKYEDINKDGIINGDDKIIMGSTIPRFTYGVNIGLGYKGFDLSLFFQGVGKANGYLNQQATMPFIMGGSALEMHKDHWTEDNPDAQFPRLAFNQTNNEQNSTFWMRSAAYLRLKNLQFGYTFPKNLISRMSIKGLRIYVSGQNLFSIDNFWDGYDVEAPVGRGSSYPQVRLYSVGIDVKF